MQPVSLYITTYLSFLAITGALRSAPIWTVLKSHIQDIPLFCSAIDDELPTAKTCKSGTAENMYVDWIYVYG